MKKIFISFFVITSSIIFSQNKSKIAFGPYIQQLSIKRATVCWSTEVSKSKVTDEKGNEKIITEYQQHKIQLGGLKPNTEYKYDILNDGSEEGKGVFRTYPNKITPFRFAVLGDTRSRHNIHSKIVNQIIELKPLFVINTGDMIGNGREIKDWESFFEINNKLMKTTQYYPVLGNHEKDSPCG